MLLKTRVEAWFSWKMRLEQGFENVIMSEVWNSMVNNEYCLKNNEFNMILRDLTWFYMNLSWICVNYHEFAWISMILHEFTWIYMILREFAWISMVLHELAWIYMILHELAWFYMDFSMNSHDFTSEWRIALAALWKVWWCGREH